MYRCHGEHRGDLIFTDRGSIFVQCERIHFGRVGGLFDPYLEDNFVFMQDSTSHRQFNVKYTLKLLNL